jgi:RHS repeat-associated protein
MLPHPDQPGRIFVEEFDFDANGHLVRAANPHVTITRRFDADGRLLEEQQGAFTVRSLYDDRSGVRVRRETSAGSRVTYDHDRLGRLSAIGVNDEPPMRIERDTGGQIGQVMLTPELTRHCRYDDDGIVAAQSVTRGGEHLFATDYVHDPAGNLVQRSDSLHGTDRYRYDPLGRILEHVDPRGARASFRHDPAGDRLATWLAPEANPSGEWRREGSCQGTDYSFDRAGALVQRSGPGRVVRLDWDADQRLIRSETNGIETRYGYDPLGRRVFKETGGQRTWFFWDEDCLVGEVLDDRPASGDPGRLHWRMREYVYYPDTFEPLLLIAPAEEAAAGSRLCYYYNDPNGCPVRLTDRGGRLLWAAGYGAWGKVDTLAVADLRNSIRFQGQYADEETDLYYGRSRYYDAALGCFVGQDKIRLAGGINLYQYAPNPWAWIDPYGTDCQRNFMRWALRRIWKDENHPLRFLLAPKKGGKGKGLLRRFRRPPTRAHRHLIHGSYLEAGHLDSYHGLADEDPERLALQDAFDNQFHNWAGPSGKAGEQNGVIYNQKAVEIGGIPVVKETALDWERRGLLPPGTVAAAPESPGKIYHTQEARRTGRRGR